LVQNLAVLERARLGFIGVAYQVDRLAAPAIDKRPLQPAGETRPTPSAQSRILHFLPKLFLRRDSLAVGELPGRQGEGLFEGLVAAVAQIAVQVGRVTRLAHVL